MISLLMIYLNSDGSIFTHMAIILQLDGQRDLFAIKQRKVKKKCLFWEVPNSKVSCQMRCTG